MVCLNNVVMWLRWIIGLILSQFENRIPLKPVLEGMGSIAPLHNWTLTDFRFSFRFFKKGIVSYWRKYVHEVLVNRLRGLSLPRKSVVRLTDRPDMTLDVYRGRKTTIQQYINRLDKTEVSLMFLASRGSSFRTYFLCLNASICYKCGRIGENN